MNVINLHGVLALVLISARMGVSLDMFIDENRGSDKNNNCSNAEFPCHSLEHIAYLSRMPKFKNNICINIMTSITVRKTIMFQNVANFSITGKSRNATKCVVRCLEKQLNENLGINFNSSTNIALRNFTVSNCGQRSFKYYKKYKQAVEVHNVSNLIVREMAFIDNTGYGLLVINSGGVIKVDRSQFINNSIACCQYGSGGIMIIAPWYTKYNSTVFAISHSYFYNNKNKGLHVCHHNLTLFKKGGGLWISIFSNLTSNNFHIYNCTFKENNATNGGGLYLEAYSICKGNTVKVSKCIFQNNTAYQESGGGADVGIITDQDHGTPQNNTFIFTDCNFTNNTARKYGGGVALFSSLTTVLNFVKFSTCNFVHNQANGGAAVDVNCGQNLAHENLFITRFLFNNCNFINNTAGQLDGTPIVTVAQSGTFLTREVNVSFSGANVFINNINTALHSESANIMLEESSHTEFNGNTGECGGAILLVGNSRLSLNNSINVIFTENSAAYGGAICAIPIQMDFLYITKTCFIQPSINRTTAALVFDSNKATTNVANDIFASTLLPCKEYCHQCHLLELFKNPGHLAAFKFSNTSSPIATAAKRLHIHSRISVFPGITHHIKVKQWDEFNNSIPSLYALSARLLTSHKNMILNTYSATLSKNTITMEGDINTTGIILLKTTALSNIQKTIHVTLADCPAGYYYSMHRCRCSYSEPNKGYFGIIQCYANHSARIFAGYWAGYLSDHKLYTAICSASLCSYGGRLPHHGQYALPLYNVDNKTGLEEYVCAKNRQGTLCGLCKDGYSTLYNSPSYTCSKCSNAALRRGILYYIISELLPVTVIFLAILLLDIRLTSGAFCTLIFYAQFLTNLYINAFNTIHISGSLYTTAEVYYNIYGILNFQVLKVEHLSFCLWKNATMMHVFITKYITTLYALLLILLTVTIMKVNSLYTCTKLCHQLGRRDIRGCIINGLSAFLILCYSQCIHITFSILVRARLFSKDYSRPIHVPLFNGDMKYMEEDHLYFAVPGILCLFVIILPPPLILLTEPLLVKISNTLPRRVAYLLLQIRIKLKPFLDSFQGCFKDDCRVFAGFYFFYRIALYLPALASGSITVGYMIAEGILFLMLLCHCLVQPFQNKWHNRLDIILLFNLFAVNTLTILSYYSITWKYTQLKDTYASIQLFLMTIPLIYISGYAGYYAFRFIRVRAVMPRIHRYSCIENEESVPARLLEENMLHN